MLKPCDLQAIADRINEIRDSSEETKPTVAAVQAKASDVDIETMVASIIQAIGVPAHIKGYLYLREAIIIAVNDMDVIDAITKVLFPGGEDVNTLSGRACHPSRHRSSLGPGRCRNPAAFLGYTVSNAKGKPADSALP
ncbi:MAG: sporulation initiation factor Spo0A C-terminal domain-containing protein [Oscillospiraceae bacterium]